MFRTVAGLHHGSWRILAPFLAKCRRYVERYAFPAYFLIEVARDASRSRLARSYLRRHNVGRLIDWGSDWRRSSDTLFILGSGSSVLDFTPAKWEIIAQHDSVGFNFWLIHRFAPSAYIFEMPDETGRIDALAHNLQARFIDAGWKCPLLLKDPAQAVRQRIWERLPPQLLEGLILVPQLTIPGSRLDTFRRSLRWIHALTRFGLLPRGTISWKRASLSFIVMLAVRLGYKQVILCGVDLNHTQYFFEDPSASSVDPSLRIPPSIQEGVIHRTVDKQLGEVTIDAVLDLMAREVLRPNHVSLYVASCDSLLANKFPCYPWDT